MSAGSLIAAAQTYTAGLATQASSYLTQAINAVSQIGYTQLTYNAVGLPQPPVVPTPLVAPTLANFDLVLPADPGATLTFQDISPIDAGTVPTFAGVAPTLNLPTKPADLAAFNAVIPSINTALVFPDPPATLLNPLIDAPILTDRVEPAKPLTNLPAFTSILPTDVPMAPTDYAAQFTNAYGGASPSMITAMDGYVDNMLTKFNPNFKPAMAAIEAQLANYLAGGTALSPSVENAIYERSKSKVNAEGLRARDNLYKDTAGRGFSIPSGALYSALSEARQSAADNNSAAAREITNLQAEMEQKNLQFAVTTSTSLRTTLLNSAIAYHQNLVTINGQALEYAKSILGAIIEVYNTAVRAFEIRLEVYKADAIVFETRLKSALAGIELYKVEISALEAMVRVDQTKVEVYRARIEALSALANVYRAQIEAVQGRASLEKLKIELFGAQAQAYSATVQAKEAEYRGYTAAIGGESARVEVYSAQLRGFNSQIEGYKATVEAKVDVLRGQVATNQARATQYSALLSGYSAVVTARGEVARTKLENQRQVIIGFQAQSQAQVANAQVNNEYYRTTAEVGIKNAGLSIEAIVQSANLARAYSSSLAGLYSSNATIYGQLAGAALSGMNSLAAETTAL